MVCALWTRQLRLLRASVAKILEFSSGEERTICTRPLTHVTPLRLQ